MPTTSDAVPLIGIYKTNKINHQKKRMKPLATEQNLKREWFAVKKKYQKTIGMCVVVILILENDLCFFFLSLRWRNHDDFDWVITVFFCLFFCFCRQPPNKFLFFFPFFDIPSFSLILTPSFRSFFPFSLFFIYFISFHLFWICACVCAC